MSASYRVVIPLPDHDFDTTESAVSWQRFKQAGFAVTFATETGRVPQCDQRLLKSGWFNPLPAGPDAVRAYQEMAASPEFRSPITFRDIDTNDFDAVHLSGGHAQGMKQYLDSKVLQQRIVDFYRAGKLIGSVCHGTLIPARSIDPATGRSIISGKKHTTLILPLEKWAFRITWYRVGRRYRTYWKYTETEVRTAVQPDGQLLRGESVDVPFVVEDGQFISARYPLDVPDYADAFVRRLQKQGQVSPATG
ncbi:type 1 glutamine amidotransferase domain-containing protein (plasmid) [Mycolicibacterium psychrotolerans]|uniref:type 1 glutamine amidotransferase domain-containing protein n=1 Tax=Mycolicibacterium psychrotolerans TaxID=216929 RepID=UPI003D66C8F9